MSFSTFFKKLFTNKSSKNKSIDNESNQKEKIDGEQEKKLLLKEIQHVYLNKTPSQISKMSVRDITMALRQLDLYCTKKIQKANSSNITKQHTNLIKQAIVSEMVSKYIYALIILKKTNKTLLDTFALIKKSKSYTDYMINFDTAYENAKKAFPEDIKFKKPSEMWNTLMKDVPDKLN